MGKLKGPAAIVVFTAAALLGLSGYWPWRRLSSSPTAPVVVQQAAKFIETLDTLQRGETLSDLLARHNIVGIDFHRLDPSLALDPRRLRPGLVFSFGRQEGDSAPTRILVRTSPEQRVTFHRIAQQWNAEAQPIRWRAEPARIEGAIDNSLYEALDAGVADSQLDAINRRRLAWDLADVYAWQIDFTRDIQPGDRFQVVYQRLVSEDGEVRFGRVLASDLTISGKSLTAVRFGGNGRIALYYDAEGNSLRRAFLRAPVEFRRISSRFASARFHPILGLTRRHEGTDYAAAPGTPVMAAGDGVVLRAGRGGGYGNLIELRHLNGITTRYGHLRGFARGIRAGMRVQQGQVIGYVGSTGLATGPHLHYEFRVGGVAKDSRKVNLGNGTPVAAADRSAFDQQRDSLLALLHQAPFSAPALAGQTTESSTRWLP
ncbi:MAG TPA: peptidoglycan DD-metalloendopeptidase family protein [Gemmatimonadales bacterium]|nr:peptidoglycan DD-metalloendopeptidase family protein [Gemmatimonadales bacterium]